MPTILSGERFYTFGVLAPDREFHAFYEKANGDNFLDFVGKVYQTFGKYTTPAITGQRQCCMLSRSSAAMLFWSTCCRTHLISTLWRHNGGSRNGTPPEGVKDIH